MLLAIAAHEGVRRCDFLHYDDNLFVTENPIVRQGITWRGVRWAFTADLLYDSHLADYWAPVTVLSRMLDVSVFGVQPAGHHLVNLFLHCLNIVLAFLVFHRLTGRSGAAHSPAAGAGRASPPRGVRCLGVSERKDMLSAVFWILTMGAYGGYARSPGPRRMFLVAALLVLGLMAKPMLVTLPFVLLLLDYWPLGRWHLGRRLISEKWPLFLLAAGSVVIARTSARRRWTRCPWAHGLRTPSTPTWPISSRRFGRPTSPWAIPTPRVPAAGACVVLCVAVLGLASAFAIFERARRPYLVVGWLWFVGALVPVIGLVQSGSHGRADRYMYIPLMGISVAVAWLAGEWAGRFPRGPAAMALLERWPSCRWRR